MLIVQKYGGTSVAGPDRIRQIACHVIETKKRGNDVVVVVSAMAGETTRLLKLGDDVAGVDRELDALISTGEQTSAALLAISINSLSIPAVSLNGSQVRIVTDDLHQRARIKYIETEKTRRFIDDGYVVVIAGFQGVTENGDITTIGRGGSDTSAVAIAAALEADVCEIYTDVDGIYSADPNICQGAKKIDKLSYNELLETAGAGAKVVHTHAVEVAAKHDVPLEIKLSPGMHCPRHSNECSKKDPCGERHGTAIAKKDIDVKTALVSTITHTSAEAKISVRRVPNKLGISAKVFESLARAGINVDMVSQNEGVDGTSDISFTVAKQDMKKAMQLTDVTAKEIGAGKIEVSGDVAKVSIVGIGMRSHSGVAAKMFQVLSDEGIAIRMISTAEIKVSVIVDMEQMKKAVTALHRAFI